MERSIKASLFVIFAGSLILAAHAPARAAQQDQQDQQGSLQPSNKTNPAARRAKPKVRATGNSSKSSIPSTRSGWTRTLSTLFRRKSETHLFTFKQTKNASSSSRRSGSGAIPIPILQRTPLRKSITAASPMPTSILLPAFRAGKRIEAEFTLPGASGREGRTHTGRPMDSTDGSRRRHNHNVCV